MTFAWTEEQQVNMRDMFAQNLTASEIAARMGGGLSRNAVIGKLHRLGLRRGKRDGAAPAAPHRIYAPNGRANTAKPLPVGSIASRVTRKVKAVLNGDEAPDVRLPPMLDPQDVEPKHISLYELTDATCRWPYGDQSPFTFCGCHPEPGEPYCFAHHRMSRPGFSDRAPFGSEEHRRRISEGNKRRYAERRA